ncbi:hypothetical protein Tco_0015971 [Tanacetum coccineum]
MSSSTGVSEVINAESVTSSMLGRIDGEPQQNEQEEAWRSRLMIDAEWPNYDAQLLTMLADGRDRNHGDYSVEFYKSLAATLSDNAGTRFSSRDVGGRAEYHRRTYQRSQGGTFTHRVMSAGDYELWLERCFDAPTDRAIRIPRCLTSSRNERSRRSRSSCPSRSCPSRSCPSVSQATMHQVAEVMPTDALVDLHFQHRERFTAHKLAKFTRFLRANPDSAAVFSEMDDDNQKLDFIDGLRLAHYNLKRAVGDWSCGELACLMEVTFSWGDWTLAFLLSMAAPGPSDEHQTVWYHVGSQGPGLSSAEQYRAYTRDQIRPSKRLAVKLAVFKLQVGCLAILRAVHLRIC